MRNITANRISFALILALLSVSCISTVANNNAVNTNANASSDTPSALTQAAAAGAETSAPDALVADLYKQHDADKSPFFQSKDRARVDKYFTKALADLIWKDATRKNQDEVGVLDGDPLYNAQDTEIKNFKVGAAAIKGESAEVPVTFDNFGKKQTIKFALAMEKGGWKIADINYGDGQTLSKWLNDEYSGKAEAQEDTRFEGKYQVGDTTCTVKPIKMAFEVKWAKGTGTEIFISEGEANDKFILASEVKGDAKSNVFAFDDENYNAGIFYGADGKEFPIKRVK